MKITIRAIPEDASAMEGSSGTGLSGLL